MRPKKRETTKSGDLFRARLDQIINLKHELAQFPKCGIGQQRDVADAAAHERHCNEMQRAKILNVNNCPRTG